MIAFDKAYRKRRELILLMALACPAISPAAPPQVLSATDRTAATDRPVAVFVPQPRLGTSIEVGRVAVDGYGGGLIGMIVISAMDDKRQVMAAHASGEADSIVAPLAEALASTDVADMALQATRKAIARTPGFDPSAVSLVPGPDGASDAALAARHRSTQVATATYRIQMSPDFTQLQVIADISVVTAPGLVPLYAQRVVSLVELRQRSYVHQENVDRWMRDDARVAKQALASAFARFEQIVPTVVGLDPASFALKTDSHKTGPSFAAGYYGPTVSRDDKGVVIWSKRIGFIAVQPASD